MTPSTFVINPYTRLNYAGFYLLKEMVEKQLIFSADLEDDEWVLEPILLWLSEMGYVKLNLHSEYKVTRKGLRQVHSFLNRYTTFQTEYDIFCGVDLKAKDFAIRYYSKFNDALEWRAFLNEDRWEDLRIAIAEYQGFDSIEIIFMGFIHDNRFGRDAVGWHYECLLGSIWDEIQAICNNAVRLKSLTRHSETQSNESFLQEIIEKGRQLLLEISDT